jgi:anti-anti-sigma regulatory factor
VGNRLCRNSNGSFVITGLSDTVKKLIQISQLDQVLNITSNLQEAVEFVIADELERNINNN